MKRNFLVLLLGLSLLSQAFAADLSGAYTALRLGDFDRAFTLFEEQARSGVFEAQYQLGKMYLAGRGEERDKKKGMSWLEQAADGNEPEAQYTLGLMLVNGEDAERGRMWLQRAATGGHVRARQALTDATTTETHEELPAAPLDWQERWWQASVNCRVDSLELLLAEKKDINVLDAWQRNALHYLVGCGDVRGVTFLLGRGADSSNSDIYGENPLVLAVRQDKGEMIVPLIRAGGDLAWKTPEGDTLLHLAVRLNAMRALQALLAQTPVIEVLDKEGYTPLDRAVLLQRQAARKALIAAGAVHGSHYLKKAGGGENALAYVLESPENSDSFESARQAAVQNRIALLETLLVEAGGELLVREDVGNRTLLMHATLAGAEDVVQLLLKLGADVDQLNAQGSTALMLAAKQGRAIIAQHLVTAGADPQKKDKAGRDAILLALQSGNDRTAQVLLQQIEPEQYSRGMGYLHQAISHGANHSVDLIVSRGIFLDQLDEHSRTALWYAADRCDLRSMEQLLSSGARNFSSDRDGLSPLHVAAERDCESVVSLLLKRGADLNSRTAQKNTALMLALRNKCSASAVVLLEGGTDILLYNAVGDSALIYAVRSGCKNILERLLQAGADPYRRNELGESARSIASVQKQDVFQILERHSGFRRLFQGR